MELNKVSLEYEDEPSYLVMKRTDVWGDTQATQLRTSVCSEWDKREVRKLRRKGLTKNNIAKKLALTEGAVAKALRGSR